MNNLTEALTDQTLLIHFPLIFYLILKWFNIISTYKFNERPNYIIKWFSYCSTADLLMIQISNSNILLFPFQLIDNIYNFIWITFISLLVTYIKSKLQSSYVNCSLQQELHYVSPFNCYFDYRDNKPFHSCYTVYHWHYFNNFTTQSYLSFKMITKLLLTLHSNSILLQLANFRNAN